MVVFAKICTGAAHSVNEPGRDLVGDAEVDTGLVDRKTLRSESGGQNLWTAAALRARSEPQSVPHAPQFSESVVVSPLRRRGFRSQS